MTDINCIIKIADKEWLRMLYAETWKQYVHEDALAQTRGTIFTAILAAVVALLGALSVQIVKDPLLNYSEPRNSPRDHHSWSVLVSCVFCDGTFEYGVLRGHPSRSPIR
jgi:hypothetical protein